VHSGTILQLLDVAAKCPDFALDVQRFLRHTEGMRMRVLVMAPFVLFVSVASCGGRATSDLFDSIADGGTVVNPPPQPFDAGKSCNMPSSKCSVSYEKDVVPIFDRACSTSSCHGNASVPSMPIGNPKLTWTNLSQFTNRGDGKLPYINPCSSDVKDSYILDNLGYDKSRPKVAGVKMPFGPPLPNDEIKVIEEWVRCGAPLN
jgi:hypothetical protein